jgi:mycothiol synthase
VLWITGADDALDAIVRGAGFAPVSELFQMRVPLPLPESPRWPEGVTVRTFVPGKDDADWLRVNNRAFRNHPDQGDWGEPTLRRRMAEPWFDPAGFVLAFDGRGLAGFCWTKVHEASGTDPRMGEIFVIGVDPDRHGTGLGRALTVAGLEHLARDRDCATGLLYVDGANAAGLGLYRALGFRVHRTDRAYELTVPTP